MNTHAVVGNTVDDTLEVKPGALCYVTNFSIATASVEVSVVDRNGEWVTQWRPGATLTNFRAKVIHKGHPAFPSALNSGAARARAATLAKAFAEAPAVAEEEAPEA